MTFATHFYYGIQLNEEEYLKFVLKHVTLSQEMTDTINKALNDIENERIYPLNLKFNKKPIFINTLPFKLGMFGELDDYDCGDGRDQYLYLAYHIGKDEFSGVIEDLQDLIPSYTKSELNEALATVSDKEPKLMRLQIRDNGMWFQQMEYENEIEKINELNK